MSMSRCMDVHVIQTLCCSCSDKWPASRHYTVSLSYHSLFIIHYKLLANKFPSIEPTPAASSFIGGVLPAIRASCLQNHMTFKHPNNFLPIHSTLLQFPVKIGDKINSCGTSSHFPMLIGQETWTLYDCRLKRRWQNKSSGFPKMCRVHRSFHCSCFSSFSLYIPT